MYFTFVTIEFVLHTKYEVLIIEYYNYANDFYIYTNNWLHDSVS